MVLDRELATDYLRRRIGGLERPEGPDYRLRGRRWWDVPLPSISVVDGCGRLRLAVQDADFTAV